MKAAFFLSAKQNQLSKRSEFRSAICQIDGKVYSELVTFEDHEEISPWGGWDDYQIICRE